MLPRKPLLPSLPFPFLQDHIQRFLQITDQGQGGAQAIEDSAALGIVLSGPSLTKSALRMEPALLSQRLHLFEQIRHDRASAMQIFSNAGQDQAAADIAEAVRPFVEGKIPSRCLSSYLSSDLCLFGHGCSRYC